MRHKSFFNKNLTKLKLKADKHVIGSWITLGHYAIAEVLTRGGNFDFLVVDMEHSSITLDIAQNLISTINGLGVVSLVRVGENNPNLIKRVMDAGAYGVVAPMVNTKEDAKRVVDSVYYPLKGKRGVGLARAQGYGLSFQDYKDWLSENAIVVAQIEDIKAIDNLEDIISVEGIDSTILGPYDLSASLGYPGDFERKEVKNAIEKYAKICNSKKKPMGIHVIPPDANEVNKRISEGFRFIAFSLDTLFMGRKIEEEFKKIKKHG